MIYANVVEAVFVSRPNRFIANVEINGCKTVLDAEFLSGGNKWGGVLL